MNLRVADAFFGVLDWYVDRVTAVSADSTPPGGGLS